MKKRTAVIIPFYNEEKNIPPLFEKIAYIKNKFKINLEVIAINDGSNDNTLKSLQKLSQKYGFLHVLNLTPNQGMAQALKLGIGEALKREFDYLVLMEGDLSNDPKYIPRFISKIGEGYDLVLGSRFVKGGGMEGVAFVRAVISTIGNFFGRLILGIKVADFTCGFRAGRREVFEKLNLEEKTFGIQLETVVKAKADSFKIAEIPIVLHTRLHGTSSMIYNLNLIGSYLLLFKKSLFWLRKK